MYTPGTEHSDANNWEKPQTLRYDADLEINGHVPFGSTAYPHKIEPRSFLEKIIVWIIIAFAIVVIIIVAVVLKRK
jgi:cytochrome oxidase assembly protein ShyY1